MDDHHARDRVGQPVPDEVDLDAQGDGESGHDRRGEQQELDKSSAAKGVETQRATRAYTDKRGYDCHCSGDGQGREQRVENRGIDDQAQPPAGEFGHDGGIAELPGHRPEQERDERHGVAEDLVTDLLADVDTAPVDEPMKPVLRLVRTLTLDPSRVREADVAAVYAAGWDERALHDAVQLHEPTRGGTGDHRDAGLLPDILGTSGRKRRICGPA